MALSSIITKKIGFGNLESPKPTKKARHFLSGFPLKQFEDKINKTHFACRGSNH